MSEKKVECPHENDKLWGGRFDKGNDELMKLFNDSLSIDKRLWRIWSQCCFYFESKHNTSISFFLLSLILIVRLKYC